MYYIILHYITLYDIILYYTILYYLLYDNILYDNILYIIIYYILYIIIYYILYIIYYLLYYNILYIIYYILYYSIYYIILYIILYYIMLCYVILYYIILLLLLLLLLLYMIHHESMLVANNVIRMHDSTHTCIYIYIHTYCCPHGWVYLLRLRLASQRSSLAYWTEVHAVDRCSSTCAKTPASALAKRCFSRTRWGSCASFGGEFISVVSLKNKLDALLGVFWVNCATLAAFFKITLELKPAFQ